MPKSGKTTKSRRTKEAKSARSAKNASKSDRILVLLRRDQGATLAELMHATRWQAHSVRGFLSGVVRKKMALEIESSRRDSGDRFYRVAKPAAKS